jgi:hypothetical protein
MWTPWDYLNDYNHGNRHIKLPLSSHHLFPVFKFSTPSDVTPPGNAIATPDLPVFCANGQMPKKNTVQSDAPVWREEGMPNGIHS